MKKNFILKDIPEQKKDLQYEYFRTIKTICVIMIIFCFSVILRKNYYDLIENSRFMKFYPTSTVFYQEFSNIGEFNNMALPAEYKTMSYGIAKNDRGKDIFIMIAKTPDKDTPIIDTKDYSLFTKDGYTFLSNDEDELRNLKKRYETQNYEFIKNKQFKKIIKNLNPKRDYTIIITDVNYTGFDLNDETKQILSKVLDKAAIQIFNTEKGIDIQGEILFKHKVAGIAAHLQNLAEKFTNKKLKIEYANTQKPTLILAVKDFDLWTKTFLKITKSMPNNQYNATFNLIEELFNMNIEKDIAQKLNGNAIFYLFEDENNQHPMLILETKRDLVKQTQKYLSFLQLQNLYKISEKEVNNQTFNILSSQIYPYDLSFSNISKNLFAMGHQNIIEKYINTPDKQSFSKKCDFYFYGDINKTPFLKQNKNLNNKYTTIDLEVEISPKIKFKGNLRKK